MFLTFFSAINIYSQIDSSANLKLIDADTITVNPELPQYILKVYEPDDDEWESIVKIHTIEDTTLIQSFVLDYGSLSTYEELKDINFDGYNDLEVLEYGHNITVETSSFWLFNPDLKIFERSEEFSGLNDVEINKENQTIYCFGTTAGHNKYFWSSTYKVIDHHLVLIEEEDSYQYDNQRNVLQGGSMVTVSRSYVEEKHDSLGKEIDNFFVHDLWLIINENMIYGKLRPVKKVWQWIFEGSNPKEVGKRLVQEYWNQEYNFIFEKEITYSYSMDENNNIYIQETIGDIIDGEWDTVTKPKYLLKE